ncbi:MAG: hypothetical protein IPO91_34315 [Chloroflexi bacterium]|nr:hypothetical protein [Chloroflexota bacterium]
MPIQLNKRKLQQIRQNLPNVGDQFVRAWATEMTSDIVLSFGSSPPGETYVRGGVAHVASSPGFPPNVDIGALKASMRWTPAGRMKAIIHDGVIYGVMLETGTERMAARPFFTPVIVDWRQNKFVPFARQFGLFR